jgi:hypothetical protein
MSDGEDLSGAIRSLMDRSNSLETAIKTARAEVSDANRKIDDLQRSQQKTRADLAAVQARLGQLGQDQHTLRQELAERTKALESALASDTAALQAQQAQLSRILSAQKEETSRRQLESERATFLSRVSGLLSRTQDGVVRLLVAERALEACQRHQIVASSFAGLADKTAAEEILSRLASIKERATDGERAEAIWYTKMRGLNGEIAQTLQNYRASAARHEQERGQLIAKQQFRQARIDELKRQSENDKKSWAPVAFVGTVYRRLASGWHAHWLERSSAQLVEADAAMARTEQTAKEFIRVNGEILRSLLRIPLDIDVSLPVVATLETLLGVAKEQEMRWRTDHGEIRLLGQ